MPSAPCAAGTPLSSAPGTHKCPQCWLHIHVLCGALVEVAPGGNQMHSIMCFDFQQGSAPIAVAASSVPVPVPRAAGTMTTTVRVRERTSTSRSRSTTQRSRENKEKENKKGTRKPQWPTEEEKEKKNKKRQPTEVLTASGTGTSTSRSTTQRSRHTNRKTLAEEENPSFKFSYFRLISFILFFHRILTKSAESCDECQLQKPPLSRKDSGIGKDTDDVIPLPLICKFPSPPRKSTGISSRCNISRHFLLITASKSRLTGFIDYVVSWNEVITPSPSSVPSKLPSLEPTSQPSSQPTSKPASPAVAYLP